MAKEDRGFASMDRSKQREIARKGGKAAHMKGTAHEWTSEEARQAGRKGGMASHKRRNPPCRCPKFRALIPGPLATFAAQPISLEVRGALSAATYHWEVVQR